jgi:ABC-type dipeptide/oligopeptide/nickel transport system permease component
MKALAKRAFLMVLVVLGAVLVIHTLIYLIPGDPAAMISGDHASEADLAAIRAELSLDEPFFTRYLAYLGRLAVMDMGNSIYTGLPVSTLILRRFPATLLLAGVSMLMAASLGIGLGVLAAVRRGRRADTAVLWISSFFISTPIFVTCFVLTLLFSHWLKVLPPSGSQGLNPAYILLPAAALASRSLALIIRVVRNELIEVLKSNYIKAARALGFPEWRVVLIYGLRNVIMPAVTIILLDFGAYLGGAVVTETVFSWPGIGRLLIMALQKRDLPLVQGLLIFGTVLFLFIGMIIEFLQARQPRAAE